MAFLNQKLEINFIDYIVDRTTNFTGREWVFQAIHQWLSDPNSSRYFLLTGEPGSGKTAIAERLTQFSQSKKSLHPNLLPSFLNAIHICSARDSTSVDPRIFCQSLARQLTKIQEYAIALANIDTKYINIQATQNLGTVTHSTIQNVVINNLDVSGLMTAQEIFNLLVLNPLQYIYQNGFNQPITILIDGLDEALTHDGKPNIADLLSKLKNLSSQIRFILTSRKEAKVETKLPDAEELYLSASEFNELNQHDVREYIEKRFVQDEPILILVAELKPQQQKEFIEQIAEKSEGNFLYVSFLLNAIAKGQRSLNDLEGLPEGLDELYYQFLERAIELGKQDWYNTYAPFIGILCVARTRLTLRQIRAFTKSSESIIWQCLNDVQQLLEEVELQGEQGEKENHYRLYHQSVIDFLSKRSLNINNRTIRNKYYLSVKDWNCQIADYYWKQEQPLEAVNWYHLDSYSYNHLAHHLLSCERNNDLYKLLTYSPDWMEAKFIGCIGDTAYVDDLEIALNSISDPLQSEEFLFLTQIHTARRVIRQRSERYYSGSFAIALIWLGREAEVLSYARLSPDSGIKYASLANTFKTLKQAGRIDPTLLEEVWQAAQVIGDFSHCSGALGAVAVEFAGIGEIAKAGEAFSQARNTAEQIDEGQHKTRALLRLAEHLCQSGNREHREEAIKVYLHARETAAQMQDCQKRAMLPSDSAMATLEDLQWQAMLLCELSNSQWQMHLYQEATEVLAEAQAIADQTKQAIDTLAKRVKELKQREFRLEAITSENYQEEKHQIILGEHIELISIENFFKIEHQNFLQASLLGAYIAMQRFEEAKQARDRITPSANNYDWAITAATRSMVSALIQTNQFLEAEDLALQIQDFSEKIILLSDIAAALALSENANNVSKAESMLAELKNIVTNQIEEKHQQDLSLYYLVQALAKVNCFDEAEEIAQKIENKDQQSAALLSLTQIIIQSNHLSEAERFAKVKRVVDGIKNPQIKVDSLADMCIALCKENYRIEAEKVLTEARKIPHIGVDSTQWIGILCGTAQLADKAGLIQVARAIFEQAKNYIKTISDPSGQSWAEYLLALNLAKSNNFFEDAENAARHIKEKRWKESVFWELAITLLNHNHFCEAERIANEIEDRQLQIDALSQLGVALFRTKHKELYQEKVNDIFITLHAKAEKPQELKILVNTLSQVERYDHAEKIASSIQESSLREEALSELASALAQKGDFSEAKRVLKEIEADWLRVKVVITIARNMTEMNDLEASAVFSMAMQEAEIIREGWQRSKVLGELAITLAQADYTNEANEAFRKAKLTAKEVMDFWLHPNGQIRHSQQAEVYRCLSEALAKAGQFTEAINILSSPEAIQVYNLLELDPFLGALLNLTTALDNIEPKFSLVVLTEAIRIAGWIRPDWNNIYELLSKLENM